MEAWRQVKLPLARQKNPNPYVIVNKPTFNPQSVDPSCRQTASGKQHGTTSHIPHCHALVPIIPKHHMRNRGIRFPELSIEATDSLGPHNAAGPALRSPPTCEALRRSQ